MCGRTACTLCKEYIQEAAQQYCEKNEIPRWIEKYSLQSYSPIYNLAPSHVIPVLVQERLLNPEVESRAVIIVPMRWGMVPSWFKGSFISDYPYSNHNCRSETILKRPTFRLPVLTGKRCVILADGYYEWKDGGKAGKIPYFIHFPNENGIKMHERSFENEKFASEGGRWSGPRLLTMAGIFDLWKSPETGPICSCSILTMDSSKSVSAIHDRMPAILDGVDAVKTWLNSRDIYRDEALDRLKPVERLNFYQVKTIVNNAKNNTVECVKPINSKEVGIGFTHPESRSHMKLDLMFERMKRREVKLESRDEDRKVNLDDKSTLGSKDMIQGEVGEGFTQPESRRPMKLEQMFERMKSKKIKLEPGDEEETKK